ncbi:MAG: hypothetical protein ACI4BG_09695 [Prevotella sp.]
MKAVEKYDAEVVYDYHNFDCIAIRLPEDKTLEDAEAYFSKVEDVVQISRDRIMHLCDE